MESEKTENCALSLKNREFAGGQLTIKNINSIKCMEKFR